MVDTGYPTSSTAEGVGGLAVLESHPDSAHTEKFVKKELADCIQYVVNMQSSRFGECICGRLRAEHTRAALTANSSRAANIADEEKVRLSFIQREVVDCERYELDMAPGVPFGQCVCGQPKAKHSEVRASVRGLTHVIPATGSTFRSLS